MILLIFRIKKIFILFSIILTALSFLQCAATKNSLVKKAPPYLQVGDSIMVVSPAGALKDSTSIDVGIQLMKDWGLKVILAPNIYAKNFTLAGTDSIRKHDLQKALDHKNIKAIICSRGGYGTNRIIDQLNFNHFKKNPKWVVGFSDITVLHTHLNNLGFQTIHATMLGGMNKASQEAKETLYKAMFGELYTIEIPTLSENKLGNAQGVLIGGNLSLLDAMIGSQSAMNANHKVIFIEDVSEPAYKVDSMIRTLERSGAFKYVKALVVGDFTMKSTDEDFGLTYKQIILEALKNYNFPIIFNFPAGHINDNRALIFGKKVKIEVDAVKSKLSFYE